MSILYESIVARKLSVFCRLLLPPKTVPTSQKEYRSIEKVYPASCNANKKIFNCSHLIFGGLFFTGELQLLIEFRNFQIKNVLRHPTVHALQQCSFQSTWLLFPSPSSLTISQKSFCEYICNKVSFTKLRGTSAQRYSQLNPRIIICSVQLPVNLLPSCCDKQQSITSLITLIKLKSPINFLKTKKIIVCFAFHCFASDLNFS